MSDRDLREIVKEVITDIDSGRIRLPRRRFGRLRALLATPVIAASLGVAAMGCDDRAVGISEDGGVQHQVDDAGEESCDAARFPDGDFFPVYGEPFPELTDASAEEPDADGVGLDGGIVGVYSVPFFDDQD